MGWVGVITLGGGAVLATAGPATAAPTADAVIRAAHFSPTTPGVDVYLGAFTGQTSKQWLSGVAYGAVSPYQRLKPGLYTISMRLHDKARTTKPVLTWTLNAKAGEAYTVAGVGAGTALKGVVIHDDLSAPRKGTGRVRVIQAASRAPVARVVAKSGPVIARDAAFASTTNYATVPAGTWTVEASGGQPKLHTSSAVNVAAGTVSSLLVLDAKTSGITVRTVLDSAATSSTPAGSVPAGGGGMALLSLQSDSPGAAASSLAALLLSVVVSGMWLLRRRTGSSVGAHAAG